MCNSESVLKRKWDGFEKDIGPVLLDVGSQCLHARRFRPAVAQASIVFPFALGLLNSYALWKIHGSIANVNDASQETATLGIAYGVIYVAFFKPLLQLS